MRFERAIILGVFCQQLGIDSKSRIEILPVKEGLEIWDLDSENQYVLGLSGKTLSATEKKLPHNLRTILTSTDAALVNRLASGRLRKWSDERETILSELRHRGIAPQELVTASSRFFKWDYHRDGILKSLDLSSIWQRIMIRGRSMTKQ
jgi:hypothetical protein